MSSPFEKGKQREGERKRRKEWERDREKERFLSIANCVRLMYCRMMYDVCVIAV